MPCRIEDLAFKYLHLYNGPTNVAEQFLDANGGPTVAPAPSPNLNYAYIGHRPYGLYRSHASRTRAPCASSAASRLSSSASASACTWLGLGLGLGCCPWSTLRVSLSIYLY